MVSSAADDDLRVQELRDEIARRKVEVLATERELKELNLSVVPPKPRNLASNAQKGLSSDQLTRLEGELADVKRLIRE